MEKKKENILALIISVGLLFHFGLGYFFWYELGVEKLYRLTGFFCMDLWGFLVFLLSRTKGLKGIGALGMALGTYFAHMEFQGWDLKDYLTLGLIFGNVFFICLFTEEFKNKI